MKKYSFLIIIFILFLTYTKAFASTLIFDGGSGKKDDPYLISNIIQFDSIRYHLSSYFVLTEDLDFTFDTQNKKGLYFHNEKGFLPIGTDFDSFTGHLDGQGNKIIGLYINRPEENHIGLFGEIRSASITNLVLVNAKIEGNSYVGGLVGNAIGSNVKNIATTNGIIKGNGVYVGGVIGANQYGVVSHSYNANQVITESSLAFAASGGLAGLNYNGTIQNAYNIGTLINMKYPSNIGGLVGYHFGGSIENTYNITTNQLVKYARGNIQSSYNIGDLASIETNEMIDSYDISIQRLSLSEMKDGASYTLDSNEWLLQDGYLPRLKELYYIEVSSISLDSGSIQLKKIGDTKTLIAKVEPMDATNQNVLWTSSNEKVAVVKDGLVTIVGYGNATITVSTQDGSSTATCFISTRIKGDVSGDGKVSLTDLSMIRKYLVSSNDDNNIEAMDINGDGKITLTDLTKIRRYLAGLEVL